MVILTLLSSFNVVFANDITKNTQLNDESSVVITLENGERVTEEEFIKILESYEGEIYKISSRADIYDIEEEVGSNKTSTMSTMSMTVNDAMRIMAGTWYIPGVGKVVVAIGGIYVGGVAIVKVSSWVANEIESWLISKAEAKEEAYEEAKEKGIKTKDHKTKKGRNLNNKDEPLSSVDLEDENRRLKQRRYYDKNGNAELDIDYSHGGVGHTFPHRHYWEIPGLKR